MTRKLSKLVFDFLASFKDMERKTFQIIKSKKYAKIKATTNTINRFRYDAKLSLIPVCSR